MTISIRTIQRVEVKDKSKDFIEIDKCSKCKREKTKIVIKWNDENKTKCCKECFDEVEKYVQEFFNNLNKSKQKQ